MLMSRGVITKIMFCHQTSGPMTISKRACNGGFTVFKIN